MPSELEFPWIKAKATADRLFAQNTGKHLSDIEIKVLQGSWEGKSYDEGDSIISQLTSGASRA